MHTVLLCIYLADPATFLGQNSVMRTIFSSESSLLKKKKNLSLYY